MDLREYPLLHEPDLMLRLLRLGRCPGATLDGAVAGLKADLDYIGEAVPAGDDDLRARLATAHDRLLIAGAVGPAEAGTFVTTTLGRRLLDEHPTGVDESVLARLPRYRTFLAGRARRSAARTDEPAAARDDPRMAEYEQGYAAFLADRGFDENPYDPDSVLHLAWENGWTEARDEAFEDDLDR